MIRISPSPTSRLIQRALERNTRDLSSVYERLSSGLRINSAKDDPAGLAISSALEAKTRIYTQGIRNYNDGISALNIADGATSQMVTILERIKELAEQAANGTYTTTQRTTMDTEAQALVAEYNRIISTTEFNGSGLLDGELPTAALQGSEGARGVIQVQTGLTNSTTTTTGVADAVDNASVDTSETQANAATTGVAVSGDGRYIAFYSTATNLVAGDTNGQGDVFLRDTQTGTTTRVNVSSAGVEANGLSYSNIAISDDGRYVAFRSAATNLVAGDVNARGDVFVRDTVLGTTTLVSVSTAGVQQDNNADDVEISADGRYVVFSTTSTNLVAGDTNGVEDIFIRDLLLNTTTRVSVDSAGTQGNAFAESPTVSSDGRYVTFDSSATNLVAGDVNGQRDVFLRDTVLGTTTLISVSTAGVQANSAGNDAKISNDGRYIAWDSLATNLVASDTNGTADIFVRDTLLNTTTRISVTSAGAQLTGSSTSASISSDGRYIGFISSDNTLVAGDSNGVDDFFVRDTTLNTVVRASVNSSGTQQNGGATTNGWSSGNSAVSAQGNAVAFMSTGTNLVGSDTNGVADAFLKTLSSLSSTFFGAGSLTALTGISLTTQSSARSALTTADTYLNELMTVRSNIGAGISRVEVGIRHLQNAAINFERANSAIRDADVADEVARMVALQIRQQSAAALLGQANVEPKLALSLIQGALR